MRWLQWSSRLVGVALVAALVTSSFVGCSGNGGNMKTRRILIMTNGDSPFWDAANAGVKAANDDFKLKDAGLVAGLETNSGGPEGQLEKLRQFVTQSDIAAIGISPCDAKNERVLEQLRKLKDKGVKIITIDSDLDRSDPKAKETRYAFLGTNNRLAGAELGKCLKFLKPEGGIYATFVGRTGAQNAIERIAGVKEGAGDKFKEQDKSPWADDEDRNRAQENVRNAIKDPNLHTLVGIWSYNAPNIVKVVKDRKKEFLVVAFDAEPGAVAAMSDKNIDAMVVQNPYQMGYQGVRLLKALVQDDQAAVKQVRDEYGTGESDVFDTGLKIVVPDEGSAIEQHKDAFDKKTEILKLGEFKKWLDKYKLTGS